MASPSTGFSWRRSLSVSSRDDGQSTPTAGALSPPPAKPQNIADSRALSSSIPTVHREPIRSFISGSVRDTSGTYVVRLCTLVARAIKLHVMADEPQAFVRGVSVASHLFRHNNEPNSICCFLDLQLGLPSYHLAKHHANTTSPCSSHRQHPVCEECTRRHGRACILLSL